MRTSQVISLPRLTLKEQEHHALTGNPSVYWVLPGPGSQRVGLYKGGLHRPCFSCHHPPYEISRATLHIPTDNNMGKFCFSATMSCQGRQNPRLGKQFAKIHTI